MRVWIFCFLVSFAAGLACAGATAADYWAQPGTPGLSTENDCAYIAAVRGNPLIHRAFMAAGERSLSLMSQDRVYTGDELIVPPGDRAEWISGNNIVAVLGGDARAKFQGVRKFPGPDGYAVTRLDFSLLKGMVRVQVRSNRQRPEAVLVAFEQGEALVLRGDVLVSAGPEWRVAVIGGQALVRLKKGRQFGKVTRVAGGSALTAAGERRFGLEESNAQLAEVPFSFEVTRAALPPFPAKGAQYGEDGP